MKRRGFLKSFRKENPEWANAKYQLRYIYHGDAPKFTGPMPRSNNPNAIRDKDWIVPYIEVET